MKSFLANNDSWFEVYKLTKEQWKSEIAAQEQVRNFLLDWCRYWRVLGYGFCGE